MEAKVTREKPRYTMWQNSGFMLVRAWRRHKPVIWLCLALAGLGVAASLLELLVIPIILGGIESAVPMGELIRLILLFAGALMLVGGATAYVENNTLFGRIAVRSALVIDINRKISTTALPNTESQDMQNLRGKANAAVSSNHEAGEAIWNTLTNLLKSLLGFAVYLLLLSGLEWWIIAVTLVTTVTGFFITNRINEWGYRHRDEEADLTRRLNYIRWERGSRDLAKDIRIFGMRPWLEAMYRSTMGLFEAFNARREKVYLWADAVDVLLSVARNGIAYLYLIGLVLEGGLSASQFLLYFAAMGGFTVWVSGILSGLATLRKQSLDLSVVREFLEYPEPFLFEEGRPLEPQPGRPYRLELRNVSFRYPGADTDTLSGINLVIRPGEKMAVVGLNGAGKTTLVKLLCGFYDPTRGEVLLDGVDIRQYNRRDYYRHFSAVFQDFSVLAVTVAENIAQTSTDIDMEWMAVCAQRAGLADKIESLPQKYQTHLLKEVYEDGVELSGGETQRLMLARALYKDAPIILLDEPTATLDPIAESDIYGKYNDLTQGRTSVYISHRLASTRFCDRILYIENGLIAEEGTHDMLIARGEKYARLFEIQSRYYRAGGDLNEREQNG